ncbi:MAG: CDP-diacylglycerol--serine O-phosphatidyltransferase, partial [Gammaproteobacteria bacterium]|nr:CDP-diacylglycerol--serine O-phosphatidyltransferase [Gammaproteobacteria bacterium]
MTNENSVDDSSGTEGEKKPRKVIYLLPNLFTTAGLFAGFYAIILAMQGQFTNAAISIIAAMILDGIDGRVARMTNTQSEFGAQYDSIADMVSFGIAPSLVMYQWSLVNVTAVGEQWAKFGWLAAFFYAAMAALRLARFNVQIGKLEKKYFMGLASPSAATLMVSFIWVFDDLNFKGNEAELIIASFVLTIIAGILMVSPVLYNSFKDDNLKGKVPFIAILVVVLIFILVTIDPPKVFFGVFFLYA